MIKNWREGFLICEHIADNEKLPARHQGFRVCCEECWKNGFLVKDLAYSKKEELVIGKIKGGVR